MKTSRGPHEAAQDSPLRFQMTSMLRNAIKTNGFSMISKWLWTRSGSFQTSPGGPPWPPSPPERWPSAPKGAPGIAQDEFKVPKSIAIRARGIQKFPRRGGSTAVAPPLLRNFWIPLALMAMLLGTSDSCWAVHGAPWGALGHLSGGLGGNGGPPGDVWKLPERVQSHLKMIEKPLVFIPFLSIEVIWKFSGGALAASGGSREVIVGVDVAQGEDLGGYFRFLQKTERGQRPLTFRGRGVNGR